MLKIRNFILLLIFLLFLSSLIDYRHFSLKPRFVVTFLDVGQGDATLLRTPTNCTILIDGGPPQALTQKIKSHLPTLETDFDLVVLTHPHLDHLAGLLELLPRYNFKNMFITGVNYNLLEYGHFMTVIEDYPNMNLVYITQPKKYFLCGITITILAPVKTQFAQDVKNINDSSIVLLFEFLDQKILITGDAEHHQEAEILAAYPNLPKVNILKAGHHGSRTSTTKPFLDAVKPDKIVISSGKDNSYSHPHPETIQKANQRQIEIFRTDQQSDIKFFFE